MCRNPFVYGIEVSGDSFWGREKEKQKLKKDILNSQNVVIYSKRRMGKTSLVKEVLNNLPKGKFVTSYLDLYPSNSIEDFISCYANSVTQAIVGPFDKIILEIKSLFKSFTPSFTVNDDGKPMFNLDFGRETKENILLDEVIEAFPEHCRKRDKQGVFVIDEFQQIGIYDKDHKLEALLRSHFQTHRDVAYIFLGSKKHLLTDIFSMPNRPFYHSTKMFPLGEIEYQTTLNCVMDRFKKTGCKINQEHAEHLIKISKNHPYYTQRLAHTVWNLLVERDKTVNDKIIDDAFIEIKRESSDYFRSLCELLTSHQLKALKTAAHIEENDKIFSKDFLSKHNWQKDSLKQVLDTLVEKDMLSREEHTYMIDDIFFHKWLLEN
ncbi:MAG: ATP-binding protein [Pseudomonadota bacterium]